MSKFTHVLSNKNPTYNFIFKLIDPKLDPHFNLEELGRLTIAPGTTLDDILGDIPTFAKVDEIAVQNGAIITVESTEIIQRLIANNGVINVDNKFQTAEKADIAISNNGSVNLTGYNLVKTINILNGGSLQYTTDNDIIYTLQTDQNINLSSNDFKTLINVAEFMHNSSGEDCFDYSGAGTLRDYKKLCEDFGNEIVQSFISSRAEVVDTSLITDNEELLNSISGEPYSSVLGSILDSVFPEKNAVDFGALDNFIGEKYFELTGVAKDPLTGFDGKLTTEVIGEISSFLSIDDVQL
jgi:hypothetical protein